MNNEASTAQEVHRVDTGKIYKDSEGNECSIMQMIRREPFWAANRVQGGEDALAENETLHRKVEELNGEVNSLVALLEEHMLCGEGRDGIWIWDEAEWEEIISKVVYAHKELNSTKEQS